MIDRWINLEDNMYLFIKYIAAVVFCPINNRKKKREQ